MPTSSLSVRTPVSRPCSGRQVPAGESWRERGRPMSTSHVLILAAGKGTRMKSGRPKVLHQVAGAPMIDYVLTTAASLGAATRTVVVGHEADLLRSALAAYPDLRFVLQQPQLGTAHAVMQAEPLFAGVRGTLVLLSGDVPLRSADPRRTLLARHQETGAAATVLTAVVDNPFGYGRVVRDGDEVLRIVEQRDATPGEREIREINSGIYAFDLEPLFPALGQVASDNAQQEYYLTDLVAIYRRAGRRVAALAIDRPEEILGINTRGELAAMSERVWQARRVALMASGVTLEDPATTYVGKDVVVGADTVIPPRRFTSGSNDSRGEGGHPRWRAHRGLGVGRRRHGARPLPRRGRAYCRGRGHRAVCAYPPRVGNLRGRAGREFRGAEEDAAGRRVESWPPGVPGRRDDRREGEHRGGHNHVQLRRRQQEPDGDRGRRLHRQRHPVDCAGHYWPGGIRGGRLVDHQGRSGRRARHRTRQAGEQGRLGDVEESATEG